MRALLVCGVNLASDLLLPFFAELYLQNFPSHPPQYLLGICVTGALGPYFHRCQSPTLLKLFWSGDPYFGNQDSTYISYLRVFLVQTL